MTPVNTAAARNWMRNYVVTNFTARDYEDFVERLNRSVAAEVPLLLSDPELQRDFAISTSSQMLTFMNRTVDLDPSAAEQDIHPPEPAHDFARTLARRGVELGVLAQLYHSGHRAMLSYAIEFIDRHDIAADFKLSLVAMMWEQTAEWINRTLDELTITFTGEREALLQGALSLRADTIRDVLSVDPINESHASEILGYSLRHNHIGVALWLSDPAQEHHRAGNLERVLHESTAAHPSAPVLRLSSGVHGMWAWVAITDDDDEAVIGPPNSDSGVRMALGEPAKGVDGFRRTHREAIAAQRIAESGPGEAVCVQYRDVELVSMLAADPEALPVFIRRQLGPLLTDEAGVEPLRATLRAFLSSHGNQEATARRLQVHKNTVRYRLQRIQELLGRDPYTDRVRLDLAMQCVDTLAPRLWQS